MPRRFSGGRPSSAVNPKILHCRLESCKGKYRTVEEIVDHLRSSYSDYSRIKQQPLTKLVRQALESMSPSSSNKRKNRRQSPISQHDGDEEELDEVNMSRKKLKKVDKSEELGDSYIRRNQYANSQYSSSTDSDDREEEDEDIDGEDGLVSTSEDAIYEQKLKPEIDLMRLMLMDRYAKLTPKKKANATQEENLEVDVNSDKSKQKIGGADEKAEGGKGLPSASSRKVGNQGIEEPRFNDFEGMKEVIEQLKREIIEQSKKEVIEQLKKELRNLGLPSATSRKVGSKRIEESKFNEFGGMKEIIEQLEESGNAAQGGENMEVDVDSSDKSKQKIEAIGGAEGKSLPSALSKKVGSQGIEGPTFDDFGGMKEVLQLLKRRVLRPLFNPQVPRELGTRIKTVRGILFHGPPGCGKTRLAHAIANETGLPFYKISAPELVSGVSGASEENIRELFSKSYRTAPSIIFIDEIDAIASKRENLQREMERRIVTQLMTCMDESHRPANSGSSDTEAVIVIGATNRPDAIDSALRKPGRFELEICLDIPDENARLEILSAVTRNHRFEGAFDLPKIAKSTPGFVGADLTALADTAGDIAMDRAFEDDEWKEPFLQDLTKLFITMADYDEALKLVQPSLSREGFSLIPNVKWEDVGGLDSLREEFNQHIVRRIKYPERYEKRKLNSGTGFLLFGPPGCGKTLIAKAVANEAGAKFIHIKGPELLSKYVGESEQAVRTLFNRARTCSPCILFFDELDALTKQRGTEGSWVVERVLNQLLIELDGGEERRGVFVIGATNRIDAIDKALLRSGRFGELHYVRLPSANERSLILKALSRNMAIDPDVDLDSIARMEACEGLSGADLNALMYKAEMAAIEDDAAPETTKLAHFQKALAKISPSVSKRDIQVFDGLAEKFKAK